MVKNTKDKSGGVGSVLMAILAIFLMVIVAPTLFAFIVSGAAMMLAGIVYMPVSIIVLIQDVVVGLGMLGAGLTVLGLGVLFLGASLLLTKLFLQGFMYMMGRRDLGKETK